MATEFIVTTCLRGTTWGSAADSPEATNFGAKPLATSARLGQRHACAPTAEHRADPGDFRRRGRCWRQPDPPPILLVQGPPVKAPQQRIGQEQHFAKRPAMAIGSAARSAEQQRLASPA